MAVTRKVTHVIFDMDGLLLDTEVFYTDVQKAILARYGKEFTWELKAQMMGKKALDAGRIFVRETGLEGILSPEDFVKEREGMLHDLFLTTNLLPGAERLIRHLHAHQIPMAVGTSSHKGTFDLKTTKHRELFALMHHVVVGDDPAVVRGKPAPDIFIAAAQRFEEPIPSPDKCLVLEDAPIGVEAAKNAKMSVVMVPQAWQDPKLSQGADEVLSSLEEFDPTSWGLPAFDT